MDYLRGARFEAVCLVSDLLFQAVVVHVDVGARVPRVSPLYRRCSLWQYLH